MDAHPSTLKFRRSTLAPLGGVCKTTPESFVVEELPAYEPCGEGEHVYLRHRRRLRTTRDIVLDLAREFGVDERDIGCAGLKDKLAVAEQTFSLPLRDIGLDEVRARAEARLGGSVPWVSRHQNKLRMGHLRGNRFTITVEGVREGAHADALRMLDDIVRRGLVNGYGPQRFGRSGQNAAEGAKIMRRGARNWLDRLRLSAWQSHLFNRWIERREAAGLLDRLLDGDIVKKTANGALFDAPDAQAEQPRRDTLEIVPTGPMWGAQMRRASGPSDQLELAVLAESGATLDELKRARLEGTRRPALVRVDEAACADLGPGRLQLSFALPKGSYATALIHELCGAAADAGEEDEG